MLFNRIKYLELLTTYPTPASFAQATLLSANRAVYRQTGTTPTPKIS